MPHDFYPGTRTPCASCLHKSSPAHHASHCSRVRKITPLPFKPYTDLMKICENRSVPPIQHKLMRLSYQSADPGRRVQLLFLCSIQNFVTRCPSKIPSPKSKIQDPQNPESKIQNPQNPKSKIQNPQNPKNPKSKIPKIRNPKSKIPKLQNPSFFGRILGILGILDFGFWGFWILDLGFRPQNPKSKIQNPKSKIPKIQNPKSSAKIQNLGRWGPHVKNCYITIQNPKSKIPKIRPKKFGFWILGILDFGFWGFWILDFGILGILDFGDFGFWILGFWGFWILGFWGFWILGFWGFWILDFGDFGDFGFWDFGDFGFWILDFGILGRSRGCTTRQFGDGAWRSEARIPPGLPLGATSKPTVSNRVGQGSKLNISSEVRTLQNHRKTQRSELYKITEKPRLPTQRSEPYKITQKNPDFQPRGQNFTKSQKNLDFSPYRQINVDYPGRRPQAPACFNSSKTGMHFMTKRTSPRYPWKVNPCFLAQMTYLVHLTGPKHLEMQNKFSCLFVKVSVAHITDKHFSKNISCVYHKSSVFPAYSSD